MPPSKNIKPYRKNKRRSRLKKALLLTTALMGAGLGAKALRDAAKLPTKELEKTLKQTETVRPKQIESQKETIRPGPKQRALIDKKAAEALRKAAEEKEEIAMMQERAKLEREFAAQVEAGRVERERVKELNKALDVLMNEIKKSKANIQFTNPTVQNVCLAYDKLIEHLNNSCKYAQAKSKCKKEVLRKENVDTETIIKNINKVGCRKTASDLI